MQPNFSLPQPLVLLNGLEFFNSGILFLLNIGEVLWPIVWCYQSFVWHPQTANGTFLRKYGHSLKIEKNWQPLKSYEGSGKTCGTYCILCPCIPYNSAEKIFPLNFRGQMVLFKCPGRINACPSFSRNLFSFFLWFSFDDIFL